MIFEILDEVRRLNARLTDRREAVAESCGLTRASWSVLAAASSEAGTVSKLARTLEQSRQGVQRVADVLVDQALATYAPNPHHRRSPLLRPTERGLRALASLEREAARREPNLDQDIEPEELETTLYVLRALREML